MDETLKKEIIIDNYNNPIGKGLINDNKYCTINMNSASCIDNLDFMVKIEDDIIKDIRYDGQSCVISTSASSIMTNVFIGKSINEAINIIENYNNMIEEKNYDSKVLEELIVFDKICMQANRKKCALLPINGLKKIIDNYKNK